MSMDPDLMIIKWNEPITRNKYVDWKLFLMGEELVLKINRMVYLASYHLNRFAIGLLSSPSFSTSSDLCERTPRVRCSGFPARTAAQRGSHRAALLRHGVRPAAHEGKKAVLFASAAAHARTGSGTGSGGRI
jgi:hypothetical protein